MCETFWAVSRMLAALAFYPGFPNQPVTNEQDIDSTELVETIQASLDHPLWIHPIRVLECIMLKL